MIRMIAALDDHSGIATDQGIPWNIPEDKAYFREKTRGGIIVMGRGVYDEFAAPMPERQNIVLTHKPDELRPGFQGITDFETFLRTNAKKEIWIIGGVTLYEQALAIADELYLTQIKADFHCTKFFPRYDNIYSLVNRSNDMSSRDLSFCFEVWKRLT